MEKQGVGEAAVGALVCEEIKGDGIKSLWIPCDPTWKSGGMERDGDGTGGVLG